MGEIEAAIGIEQLKKLDKIIKSRQNVASELSKGIKDLKFLRTPYIPKDRDHVHYTYPILVDEDELGVSSKKLCKALQAEGVSIGSSYINLHTYPTYKKRLAYGGKHFPWKNNFENSQITYNSGDCPVAEGYNKKGYLTMQICNYEYPKEDIELVVSSFKKVWENIDELKN